MSLTPLGLMIGPLNKYAGDPRMTPVEGAENIEAKLRRHGYEIRHVACGLDWTYCRCPKEPT